MKEIEKQLNKGLYNDAFGLFENKVHELLEKKNDVIFVTELNAILMELCKVFNSEAMKLLS